MLGAILILFSGCESTEGDDEGFPDDLRGDVPQYESYNTDAPGTAQPTIHTLITVTL
jgi:hypothetical protein